MELTQKDFEDRKARVEDGSGDDEDRRLVKLYENEGFTSKQSNRVEDGFVDEPGPEIVEGEDGWPGSNTERSSETTPDSNKQSETNPESPARTTESSSSEDSTASSTVQRGTGSGKKQRR